MRKQGVIAVITAVVMFVGVFFMTGVSAKAEDGALALSEMQAEESAETGEKTDGDWMYRVLEDGTAEITGYDGETTEIEIPDSVGGASVTSIWYKTFYGCNSLTEVSIPEGVTSIGSEAFSGCGSLREVSIPESVTFFGGEVFEGTPWLDGKLAENPIVILNNIVIDARLTSESVSIPEGVTSIGFRAFSGCSSLREVGIPDNVIIIGDWAFENCSSLREISIPDSVTSIEFGAFNGCGSLTEISIPDSVTSIGDMAFAFCSSLREVSIPDSVMSIGENSFVGCNSDFTIYGYPGTAAETYATENGFTFIEMKDKPTETPSDAEITVNASGELSPKLETAKEELLSAIAKYLTEDELSAVRAGASVLEIKLSVASLDGKISESDKELIAKAVGGISGGMKLDFKVMNYLDIKLSASIDGRELAVAETDGLLTVSVELENPVNGTYKVIRIHDGKAEAIDAQLSKDGKRLSFAMDKFSTYAIAYSDLASGDSTRASIVIIAICIAGLSGLAAGTASVLKKRGAA